MTDVLTETPETLFNEDFPELESLSDEARILCVDRNTETNLMEWYQAPLSLLKWDKWDKWDTWAKWDTWPQWPRGYQGETWDKWDKWDKGDPWEKWAKWDKGDPWQAGTNGADWQQWPAGNGIAWMTSSKNGKVTTVTFEYTLGGSDSFQVQDWADGAWWGWDVTWPDSSTNERIAVFNGATGKAIKDGGKKISDLQDKLVSGTNIKTINNNSLLGGGNITISGGSYSAWTNISISSNTINCTLAQKTPASWGTADSLVSTWDMFNWNQTSGNVNTKTFSLSNTSDLTNASKAYAWYDAGKTPIIYYDWAVYLFYGYSSSTMTFYSIPRVTANESNSTSYLQLDWISIAISAWSATSITTTAWKIVKYLDTNVNYSTPYTPTYDGSPATKKYVDDHTFNPWAWTTGQVLKKTADGYGWANESWGGGWITNNTTWTTSTITQVWAWTEAEYSSLGSKSASVLYFTF